MIFKKIFLQAYGPFQNETLDFSKKPTSLHLVYGPNEAGKSSALDGILDFLFGFPHLSAAGFVHKNRDLRIGSELCFEDGSELSFFRKKAKANSLLDADGEPVEENLLQDEIGLDRDRFASQFGISYQQLLLGGRELSQGKGDLASTLFAATAGSTKWNAARKHFAEKAKTFFAPTGKTKVINSAIKEYWDLEKTLQQNVLEPTWWQNQQQELKEIQEQLSDLEKEEKNLEKKKTELDNIQKREPLLKRFFELKKDFEQVALPFLFSELEKQKVESRFEKWKWNRKRMEEIGSQLNQLEVSLKDCRPNLSIAELKDQVALLVSKKKGLVSDVEEVQRVRKALKELENKRTEQSIEIEIPEDRLADLSKWIETKKIQNQLYEKLQRVEKDCAEAEAAFEGFSGNQLPIVPELPRLQLALEGLRSHNDRVSVSAEGHLEFHSDKNLSLVAAGSELGILFSKDIRKTDFPQSTIVSACSKRWRQFQERQVAISQDRQSVENQITSLQQQVEMKGESAECQNRYQHLQELRKQANEFLRKTLEDSSFQQTSEFRDWVQENENLLQLTGNNQNELLKSNHPLVGVFEALDSVLRNVVDELLADSKNLHQLQHLQDQLEQKKKELTELSGQSEKCQKDLSELVSHWEKVWSTSSAQPPISSSGAIGDFLEELENYRVQWSERMESFSPLLASSSESVRQVLSVLEQEEIQFEVDSSLSDADEYESLQNQFRSKIPAIKSWLEKITSKEGIEFACNDLDQKSDPWGTSVIKEWTANGLKWCQVLSQFQSKAEQATNEKQSLKVKWESCLAEKKILQQQFDESKPPLETLQKNLSEFIDEKTLCDVPALEKWFHNRQAEEKSRADRQSAHGELQRLEHQVGSWVDEVKRALQKAIDSDPNGFPALKNFLQEIDSDQDRGGEESQIVSRSIAALEELEKEVFLQVSQSAKRQKGEQRQAELTEDRSVIEKEIQSAAEEIQSTASPWFSLRSDDEIEVDSANEWELVFGQTQQLLERYEKSQSVKGELESCQETLLQLGASSFDLQAGVTADASSTFNGERQEIENLQKELKAKISDKTKELALKQRELNEREQSVKAISDRQKLENLRQKIQSDIVQYLKWKSSELLLEHSMNIYSKQQQDPILPLASNYFRRLSCEGFEGICTELVDSGKQVLLAKRSENVTVPVSGLSEGSETQLYLAIRLAALVNLIENGGRRLPLILDDILKDYDDHRAAAALEVLSEVAGSTQVILFTHHQHLIEIAKEKLPAARYQIHSLQSGHSPSRPPQANPQRMLF